MSVKNAIIVSAKYPNWLCREHLMLTGEKAGSMKRNSTDRFVSAVQRYNALVRETLGYPSSSIRLLSEP
jgi:hypothetical protein